MPRVKLAVVWKRKEKKRKEKNFNFDEQYNRFQQIMDKTSGGYIQETYERYINCIHKRKKRKPFL
jgi:hypothetical protein